ncbi:hypothetical protein ACFSTI_29430 [Rhizorhabdus histidinilytica]|uniref:Uncharacterized protein n=1 Tax=Rhizorhabdus histidinilytica TaxID=439228 RepID=A0A1T5CI68_9SPHN|nr:hypothetical protein [Rhizorhabdus histidinilytica]SKB59046.1 hypothetical protein SAMN06295920_10476 [Rhizorhabdus histidinilytica]
MNSFHSFGMTEVATSAIVSMRRFKRSAQDWAYKITLSNGEGLIVETSDVSILLERPIQLIPAPIGTSICHFNDEDWNAHRAQVIAWALCADGEVRPVTPAGVNDSECLGPHENLIVELPDGTCHETGFDGRHFASLDELVEDRKAWVERARNAAIQQDATSEAIR